jgi:hypothetical protein
MRYISYLFTSIGSGKIYRVDVLPKLVKRLEELIAWFTEQETFLFLSSSVLLMYDGDGESADVSS